MRGSAALPINFKIVTEKHIIPKLLLSVCVPTFQRKNWIASLIEQFDRENLESNSDSVELVIIDNASEESFWSFLTNATRTRPWLRLQRNSANVGIEGNIVQSLLATRGTYTWLLSDHQKLRVGVLEDVIAVLREKNPDLVCMALENWRRPLLQSRKIKRLDELSVRELSQLLFTFGNMSTVLFRSEMVRDHMRYAVRISWFNYPNLAFVRSWQKETTVLQIDNATALPALDRELSLKKSYDPFEASFINNLECISRVMEKSELRWSRSDFQTTDYIRALGVQIILKLINDIDNHRKVFSILSRAAWVNLNKYVGFCSLLCIIGSLISLMPIKIRKKIAKLALSVAAPHSLILKSL